MATDHTVLYHGTTHDFNTIDVNRGKPYKDFGQGFYATQSRESAINMSLRNRTIDLRRLQRRGMTQNVVSFLYTFELNESELTSLKVKRFGNADKEWVLFITDNRTHNPHRHDYDVVIGPTANDQTNPTIQTYLNGGYGDVGSERAMAILIELLEPYKLPYQYYFGTQKAAGLLDLKGKGIVQ